MRVLMHLNRHTAARRGDRTRDTANLAGHRAGISGREVHRLQRITYSRAVVSLLLLKVCPATVAPIRTPLADPTLSDRPSRDVPLALIRCESSVPVPHVNVRERLIPNLGVRPLVWAMSRHLLRVLGREEVTGSTKPTSP